MKLESELFKSFHTHLLVCIYMFQMKQFATSFPIQPGETGKHLLFGISFGRDYKFRWVPLHVVRKSLNIPQQSFAKTLFSTTLGMLLKKLLLETKEA